MGEEIIYCIPDAILDGDRIHSYIRNVVCNAFESGIKMSSCQYKNHSITLDVNFEPDGCFDKLLLEILYGDKIRKTIERLNYEWLKKMWKASDDDFRVFWFEQIRKKFEEHEDQNGFRWQI